MNLIPNEYLSKIRYDNHKKLSIIISFLLCVFLFVFLVYTHFSIEKYQQRFEILNKEYSFLSSKLSKYNLFVKEKKNLEEKKIRIKELSDNLSYVQLLKDINLLIPEDIAISSLSINHNKKLQIEGKATDNFYVIELINNLERYPLFTEINLKVANRINKDISLKLEGRVVSAKR